MMALINSLLTLSKQVRANICAMIFAKCRRLHFSRPTPLRRGARRNVQLHYCSVRIRIDLFALV